LPDLSIF